MNAPSSRMNPSSSQQQISVSPEVTSRRDATLAAGCAILGSRGIPAAVSDMAEPEALQAATSAS